MTIPTLDGRCFMVGKFEIRAAPIAQSAQMLRYTVCLDGKAIGAMASVPSEADCRSLERASEAQANEQFESIPFRPGRFK